jgi:hypothetical protein
MKKINIKNVVCNLALGLGSLSLVSCSGFGTIVKMPKVKEVPGSQYERIIKLNNPSGSPDETLAGLVFINSGASVCTDYPREETIKNLDELTMMEKRSYKYFSKYAIEAGGKIFGFVSIPVDYQAILWQNEKDENCQYKVQIIWLGKESNDIMDRETKAGSGGGQGH